MAEYIEREALQEALQRKKSGVADRRYTEGWNDCLLRVKSMVHSAKAADIAPVVHGAWKPYQTPIETRQSGWICTNCSGVQSDVSNGDTAYCPYCGARMDGDS